MEKIELKVVDTSEAGITELGAHELALIGGGTGDVSLG